MDEITPRELLINHIEHRNEIKRKRRTITLLSFLIMLGIIMDLIIIAYFAKPRYKTLDVIPYEHLTLPEQAINCNLTKSEIKEMLDAFYQIDYIYHEIDLSDSLSGGYTKDDNIYISIDLSETQYLFALAHELTHIKYNSPDETFVEYQTIEDLINSGNPLFKEVAMNRARLIVSGGVAGTEYDCGYYLLKYFSKK